VVKKGWPISNKKMNSIQGHHRKISQRMELPGTKKKIVRLLLKLLLYKGQVETKTSAMALASTLAGREPQCYVVVYAARDIIHVAVQQLHLRVPCSHQCVFFGARAVFMSSTAHLARD